MKLLKTRIFALCVLFLILISIPKKNIFAGDDKLKHFGISSIFGAASETYLHYKTNLKASERIILGTALGTLPGLVKELIDSTKRENHFSGSDLAMDVAGAFVGAMVGNFLNNIIQVKIKKENDKRAFTISFSYEF